MRIVILCLFLASCATPETVETFPNDAQVQRIKGKIAIVSPKLKEALLTDVPCGRQAGVALLGYAAGARGC